MFLKDKRFFIKDRFGFIRLCVTAAKADWSV